MRHSETCDTVNAKSWKLYLTEVNQQSQWDDWDDWEIVHIFRCAAWIMPGTVGKQNRVLVHWFTVSLEAPKALIPETWLKYSTWMTIFWMKRPHDVGKCLNCIPHASLGPFLASCDANAQAFAEGIVPHMSSNTSETLNKQSQHALNMTATKGLHFKWDTNKLANKNIWVQKRKHVSRMSCPSIPSITVSFDSMHQTCHVSQKHKKNTNGLTKLCTTIQRQYQYWNLFQRFVQFLLHKKREANHRSFLLESLRPRNID